MLYFGWDGGDISLTMYKRTEINSKQNEYSDDAIIVVIHLSRIIIHQFRHILKIRRIDIYVLRIYFAVR